MGLREGSKPCEWVYLSLETLKLLQEFTSKHINRHRVRRYAKHHNLVLPKYMRKLAWRLIVKTMPREIARFIQSKFGKLRVSEARYEDLLNEADENYPRYLKHVEATILNIGVLQ